MRPLIEAIEARIAKLEQNGHDGVILTDELLDPLTQLRLAKYLEEIKQLAIAEQARLISAFTDERDSTDYEGFLFYDSHFERAIKLLKGE